MIQFDHLAIAVETLSEGAAWVEQRLGVPLEQGGEHAAMGTHNRLLSLGPDAYLEVIAINPAAPRPPYPRWFHLDAFEGAPALRAWILRCDDLGAALSQAPKGAGAPMAFQRGALHWQMAVPETGLLPFDGCFPALIEWGDGVPNPASRLPDRGVRLLGLTIRHPEADALRVAVAGLCHDDRISVQFGEAPKLQARFATPLGEVVL